MKRFVNTHLLSVLLLMAASALVEMVADASNPPSAIFKPYSENGTVYGVISEDYPLATLDDPTSYEGPMAFGYIKTMGHPAVAVIFRPGSALYDHVSYLWEQIRNDAKAAAEYSVITRKNRPKGVKYRILAGDGNYYQNYAGEGIPSLYNFVTYIWDDDLEHMLPALAIGTEALYNDKEKTLKEKTLLKHDIIVIELKFDDEVMTLPFPIKLSEAAAAMKKLK